MKCIHCGSNRITINQDTASIIKGKCLSCEFEFTISKVSIGKNRDLFFYVDKLREKLLEYDDIVIEARGDLIPKMLIITGNIVLKDKLARIESVDVVFTLDKRNRIVATETILLRRIVGDRMLELVEVTSN